MTDAQHQSEYTPEEIERARLDEENSLQAATLSFLQNRVVVLNLEVRKRDAEIQRLTREVHLARESQDLIRRREAPETVQGEVEATKDSEHVDADTDM